MKSIRRRCIGKIISLIVFLSLVLNIFLHLTYLFRNSDFAGRAFILDFRSEPKDTLDVVYIGGSNVYCYYDPMMAWEQLGVTSYCYSIPQMDATVMLGAIRDVYKTQKPELIICDVRKFLSSFWYKEISMGFRTVADSFDVNLDRFEMVDYFRRINNLSIKEVLQEYIDLIYYHTNHNALTCPDNWKMWENSLKNVQRPNNIFKGYRPVSADGMTAFFKDYSISFTEEREKLPEYIEKCYRDLLEYCKNKNIKLLLVESPYIVLNEKDIKETNTLYDIACEYGVPFLNFNLTESYEKLSLDFTTDIYDCNHLNRLGTEKYTNTIISYLGDHYTLPDHRGGDEYYVWDELYNASYLPYIQSYKLSLQERANDLRITLANEDQIRGSKDYAEWFSLVDDPNITLLIAATAPLEVEPCSYANVALKSLGIDSNLIKIAESYIEVYSDGVVGTKVNEREYSDSKAQPTGVPWLSYSISMREEGVVFSINGKEFASDEKNDIYILAMNNNTECVIDFVGINFRDRYYPQLYHFSFNNL